MRPPTYTHTERDLVIDTDTQTDSSAGCAHMTSSW